MQPDDVVVFTRGHYEVLRDYRVIREEIDHRLERTGRVVEVGIGWVSVLWGSGMTTCHFPDNLQVLRSASRGQLVG